MPSSRSERLQRTILNQLLCADRPVWTRGNLEATLGDATPLDLLDALHVLHEHNVIHLDGEHIHATSAARYLDRLEMISL